MNGCILIPIGFFFNLFMGVVFGLAHGWAVGSPISGWYVTLLFFVLSLRYRRMGMRLTMNFAVTLTLANFAFMWLVWREPHSIALGKAAAGDVAKGKEILDRALVRSPDISVFGALYAIGSYSGYPPMMARAIDGLRSAGGNDAMVRFLEAEKALLAKNPAEAEAKAVESLESYPGAIHGIVLHGRACMEGGYLEEAERHLQMAIEKGKPLRGMWLRNLALHLEIGNLMADAKLCLSHIARTQGRTDDARRWASEAVDEFGVSQFGFAADAPTSCFILLRQKTTGNLVYTWAIALAVPSETAALTSAANARLGRYAVDVDEYVNKHLSDNTIPQMVDDFAAVQSASLKEKMVAN
jgi:tetratricopeptide (TPR) repeat protein